LPRVAQLQQRVVTFLRNIPSHSGALLGESAHGLADLGILLLNFVAAVRVAYAKPRLGSAATFGACTCVQCMHRR
jgi:Co/Zn/Cd efflux system component